jgi:predicted Rossmann-fold nucleotide-binding protein
MGNARNNINILSSEVVVVCGMGAGTLSEVALAMKAKTHVIFLQQSEGDLKLIFKYAQKGTCSVASSAKEVVNQVEQIIDS